MECATVKILFLLASISDYVVTCGEHKLNTNEPFQVDLTVTEIVVHPKFKSAETGFDIAVYKVNSNESIADIFKP